MTNSPSYTRIVSNATSNEHGRTEEAILQWERFVKAIPGWSLPAHAVFFRCVAKSFRPQFRSLVCGVYHGFDLALLQWAAREEKCTLELDGVDLFSDGPCADWNEGQRERGTWEANGFGPPPSIVAAKQNAGDAVLHRANSIEFMQAARGKREFDFIYLDTSHDYETVKREIIAAREILAPGGTLAGDDYYEPGAGWGVDRAVCEVLPHHVALWGRIWVAT